MVLIGGDVAGAYVITSWLSESLVPDYSWRILWLLGLPTGLLLLLLNHWIPESPRFLLAHGREEEAQAVMERYGATVVSTLIVAVAAPVNTAALAGDEQVLLIEKGLAGKNAQ